MAWTLDIGQWCKLLLHFAFCGLYMAWHHLIRYIDKRTVWRPVATRSWRVGLSPTCVLVGVLFCKFGQSRPIFGICTSSSSPTNFLRCILILRRTCREGRMRERATSAHKTLVKLAPRLLYMLALDATMWGTTTIRTASRHTTIYPKLDIEYSSVVKNHKREGVINESAVTFLTGWLARGS